MKRMGGPNNHAPCSFRLFCCLCAGRRRLPCKGHTGPDTLGAISIERLRVGTRSGASQGKTSQDRTGAERSSHDHYLEISAAGKRF